MTKFSFPMIALLLSLAIVGCSSSQYTPVRFACDECEIEKIVRDDVNCSINFLGEVKIPRGTGRFIVTTSKGEVVAEVDVPDGEVYCYVYPEKDDIICTF
jgi:hypothetical protein